MRFTGLLFFLLVLFSCKKEIEVELPEFKSQLVVESYLTPGLPYAVYLRETIPYFDTTLDAKIDSAEVKIYYGSDSITLYETTEGVYISKDTVPYDYNTEFRLLVSDKEGRKVTGSTKILNPVSLDSVKVIKAKDSFYALTSYFTDDKISHDYYQLFMIHNKNYNVLLDDVSYNGIATPFISGFVFRKNENVDLFLLHISKEYIDYLHSTHDAYHATLLPITEPSYIKSNVTGGLGIFTGFSYSKKTIKI